MSAGPIARWRLNLLRLGYLILAVGQAAMTWPELLGPRAPGDLPWTLVQSQLAAIGVCAAIGVLRPLQMLPVMLVEVGWKAIWISTIAQPAWANGTMDAKTLGVLKDCLPIIPFMLLIPWDQVWRMLAPARADPA